MENPGSVRTITANAPTAPVLRQYLGRLADKGELVREESLQIALTSWLADFASAARLPKDDSEADQMLVRSGLLKLLERGEVKPESH